MTESSYATPAEFASLAEISPQAARKAIRGALKGRLWRDVHLVVKQIYGRGGKSGWSYGVSRESISAALERPLSAHSEAVAHTPTALAPNTPYALFDKALVAPTRQARGEAVRAAADVTGKSVRTIQRKVAKVREGGAVAALRRSPKNAGQPRVAISRAFMKCAIDAGWSAEKAWSVHLALKTHVRALWTSQAANAGWRVVATLARKKLARDFAAELAEVMTPAEARAIFDVSKRFVESERRYALRNRQLTDAKAHYDERPGALLDLNACGPMELVYGDVHHLDVKLRRENGEPAFSVKMVACMDVGNRRVFARFFNMPKGRMVRQENVAETFALMALQPKFGMPSTLYVDNGSEYKMFDHMVDAFKLMGENGYKGSLVHSTAYNPRGKAALESFFAHFERYYLSLMPGYAGGDRQRQKTANQGREVEVADWSWEQAEQLLYALLECYNNDPRETLGGRSPNEVFEASVCDWRPTTISTEALAFGLSKRKIAKVRQGIVRISGSKYRIPDHTLEGQNVTVLLSPWMSDSVVVQHESRIFCAALARRYHPLDPAGARESSALTSANNRQVAALSDELPKVNPVVERLSDNPAVIDLIAGPKSAFRKALSAKERHAEESREVAGRRARDAEQDEAAKFLLGGGTPRESNAA